MARNLLILAITALVLTSINGQATAENDELMKNDSGVQDTKRENPAPEQLQVSPGTDDSSKQETPNEEKETSEPEPVPNTESNTANEEATKQPLYVMVPAPNPFPNLGNSPFYIRPLPPHFKQPMGPLSHPPPFPPQPMGFPPSNLPLPYFPPPIPQYPFNPPQWTPFMPMPNQMPPSMMLPPQMQPIMMKPADANQLSPQVILLNEQKNPEGTVTGQSAVYVKHDGNREVVVIKK